MTRRDLFKRLTGGLAAVGLASVVPSAQPASWGQELFARGASREFTAKDILMDSLRIEIRETDERCEFSTLASPPFIGQPVVVRLAKYGTVFSGVTTEVIVRSTDSTQQPFISRICAQRQQQPPWN
jgi:hypothetical protein